MSTHPLRKQCHRLGKLTHSAHCYTRWPPSFNTRYPRTHALLHERRPVSSPAAQAAPVTVVSTRRKPNMRRGSTEGVLDLEGKKVGVVRQEGRRGSFLFDLPDSVGDEPRADSPLQGYDTLRNHDDVDADLDLAAERLPAGAFTGSRDISELDLEAAAQLAGSKSAPAAAGQQGMQMRSATEVQQAVSRARRRMPSDEWSEEARRTTHEVLVTFDAISKPDEGAAGESDGLTVWRSPDELPGDSGGSSGGALESYNPQRLTLDTTADDPTHTRQHSKSPSVSPRTRGASTPGGRSRQKTVWSATMSSSGDEEHQQDWSDTDSDHDGEDGPGPAGGHGHHKLRNGSGGADDDGAHRIGGTNEFYGAQHMGGVSSNDGTDASIQLRSLAPAGHRSVTGNGTLSADLHSTLVAASGVASGSGGDKSASASADVSDLGKIDVVDLSATTPSSEPSKPQPAVDSAGALRGGGGSLVGNALAGGNNDPMQQMLTMMSERCTKVQQEKHQLEERVAELEAEKQEWETLKARLISALVDDGED